MDTRKRKEREWANERFRDFQQMHDEDHLKKHSNKKFYSITRTSQAYIFTTIREASRDGLCLDYCCGMGNTALEMAVTAKKVYGIDISPEGIKIASRSASQKGLSQKVDFKVMDAEKTDFPDQYFDFITCTGVLHHLDIHQAFKELSRILRPSGLVLCVEPLKYNPVFQLYRKFTPHLRTEWESDHILGMHDIKISTQFFQKLDIRFFHLLTLAAIPFRKTAIFGSALKKLETIDEILLRVPYIQRLAWQAIFKLSDPIFKPSVSLAD